MIVVTYLSRHRQLPFQRAHRLYLARLRSRLGLRQRGAQRRGLRVHALLLLDQALRLRRRRLNRPPFLG